MHKQRIHYAAAKAYLRRLKASAPSDDDDDADGGGGGGAATAFLSETLQAEAKEAAGRALRRIAARVALPPMPSAPPLAGSGVAVGTEASDGAAGGVSTSGRSSSSAHYGSGRLLRGHRLSATAVALSSDDAVAFTTTKCGALLRWDIESGTKSLLQRPGDKQRATARAAHPAEWVHARARRGSARALLCVAASSDGRYLAAGGGDRKVHVWDLRTDAYIQVRFCEPGHSVVYTRNLRLE